MTTAPAVPNPFASTTISTTRGELRPSFEAIGRGKLVMAIARGEVYKTESQFADRQDPTKKAMVDALIIDLVIVEPGEILFGGDPANNKPHTHKTATPTIFRNISIMGARMVDQIATTSKRNAAQGGIVLGRLGTKRPQAGGNSYWELLEPTPQDIELAMPVWANLCRPMWDPAMAGHPFQVPPVIELAAQAAAPPQFAGAAQAYPAQPAQAMNPYPQWPAQAAAQVAQPMAYPQAPIQQAPAPAAAMPGWMTPPAATPVEHDWTLLEQTWNQVAPNMAGATYQQWEAAGRENREQFLKQAGIHGPNVAPAQPTGL